MTLVVEKGRLPQVLLHAPPAMRSSGSKDLHRTEDTVVAFRHGCHSR